MPRRIPTLSALRAGLLLLVLMALCATVPTARADTAPPSDQAVQAATFQATKACARAKRRGATAASTARCVRLRRKAAALRRRRAAAAPAPAGATPAAAPTRPFAADSPFNTPIGPSPRINPRSDALVAASVAPFAGNANLASSDGWGTSVVPAAAGSPLRHVGVFDWGFGADVTLPAFPIPDGAAPSTGDDHHIAVIDGDRELDLWGAQQQPDGSWKAGSRAVVSLAGDGIAGPYGANAAGFALTAGLVRPEELAAGHIDHALQFTSPYIRRGFLPPAVKGDGGQSDHEAMLMGTRVQLDPAVDVSGLPPAQRTIAVALQEYGAYLSDTGGSLAIYAETSVGRGQTDLWTPVGAGDPNLRQIPWDKLRVIVP